MNDDRGHPTRRAALTGLAALPAGLSSAFAQKGTPSPSSSGASPPLPAPIGLRAVRTRRKLLPEAGAEAEIWRFEGLGDAPVLRVRHGDPLALDVSNGTGAPLSFHLHGVRGPNATDGSAPLTGPAIAPDGTAEIRLTPPDAGTYLIRPGMLGGSGEASGRGLVALLVVEERQPPAVDADLACLIADWSIEPDGQLTPFQPPRADEAPLGRLGNRVLANGAPAPQRLELPRGSRLRLRLANACNARTTRIRFDGAKVFVAAVDGQPTETFEPLRSTLPFPPGTRYDLLLDLPPEAGAQVTVMALIGPGLPLVVVTTAGPARAVRTEAMPSLAPNRMLPAEVRLQNAARGNVVLAGGPRRAANGAALATGPWTVNGRAGAGVGPPLLSVRRGQPVVLGVTNQTGFPQPLHLHGHVFRLLHPLDDGWEPYWLDTFQAPEGKTAHIAFLADNPGKWLFGSTILERRDAGLWTWLEVT